MLCLSFNIQNFLRSVDIWRRYKKLTNKSFKKICIPFLSLFFLSSSVLSFHQIYFTMEVLKEKIYDVLQIIPLESLPKTRFSLNSLPQPLDWKILYQSVSWHFRRIQLCSKAFFKDLLRINVQSSVDFLQMEKIQFYLKCLL